MVPETTSIAICQPNLSKSEKNEVELVSLILKNRGVELDNIFIQKENLVARAKTLRVEVIKNLDEILNCGYWRYNDYSDVYNWVKWYLMQLMEMKKWYELLVSLKPIKNIDPAILSLQSHIIDMFAPFVNQTNIFSQTSSGNVTALWTIPEMWSVDFGMNYNTNSAVDLQQNLIDVRAKVESQIKAQDTMWFFKIAWNINFDIALKQYENLFIQLINAESKSLSGDMSGFFSWLNEQISGAKAYLKDSFLQVWDSQSVDFKNIISAGNLLAKIKTTPMMDIYHQQDGIYYGIIWEWVCGLTQWDMKNSCLDEIQKSLIESNWKWYIFIDTNLDNKLGLTDDFTNDKWLENFLNHYPIINWNNQRINSVSLPFNAEKSQWMNYSADKALASVKYSDDMVSIDLSWTVKKNLLDLKWVFTFTGGFNWYLNLSMITNPINNAKTTNITFTLKKSNAVIFSAAFNDQTITSFLNSFNKIIPSKVIMFDDFMKAMEKINY